MASVPSLPQSRPARSRAAISAPAPARPRAAAEHGFEAQEVIDRHAIEERVGAAGVGGHVAADGRGPLAGRVGGEVVAGAGQGLGKLQVGHPRLDHRHAVAEIDLQHAIHPCQREHHAAAMGGAPPGQPRAGAAGDQRRVMLSAGLHGGDDMPRRAWENHNIGGVPRDGQGVAIVDGQFRRGGEDIFGPQAAAEFADQRAKRHGPIIARRGGYPLLAGLRPPDNPAGGGDYRRWGGQSYPGGTRPRG